ncbi:hypothetical protein M9H77_11650 [Catharanthus roseus]|uniref:Uncharacterized protein n=1 Tax=Catharanthus roseus TaxID=4058 RepID=A0ACC0BF68_CATRO|nr:hypothetical protein M9H77_11650 [Catharanthus roseus]
MEWHTILIKNYTRNYSKTLPPAVLASPLLLSTTTSHHAAADHRFLIRMDPPIISSDNLTPQNFTDNQLDKLPQRLNEFQIQIQSHSSITCTVMDFLDSFLTPCVNNNWNISNSLQTNLTTLLHDFEEYETKMLHPCARNFPAPTHDLSSNAQQSYTYTTEILDTQVMIEETYHDSTTAGLGLNMTFDHLITHSNNLGGTSGLGGMNSSASFHGSGFFSSNSFGASSSSSSSSVRYFHCKENSSWSEKDSIRRRRKRKYKGIVETEEETALRLERTKIRNREAAAKAHHKKQDHEANLKCKLLRLRKKNKFLKNFLMFLEDGKSKGSFPMPLRRTISGPM